LGCGQGRHSILLAKKGYNVTGIDYSDYLLKIAKNRAKKEKVKINFIKKDAKKLDFENEFDVILNLFTSFGYETDKNNEKIIEKVSKALKKGGKFLIDLINVVWLLKNYKKVIIIKKNIGIAIDENFFDPKTFVNISKRTIFFKNGKKKEDEIRLRMYTFPEMRDLLKRHNLVIKKVFGSYDKEKFNFNSKRMIILAQRVK
jgi:SAM-dependent methyltransferase